MSKPSRAPSLLGALLLLAGCTGEPTPSENPTPSAASAPAWKQVDPEGMDEGQRQQRERALAAKKERGELGLMKRLREALAAGGPAAAIDECKLAAPGIADEVSRQRGLRIGRTSFKLRNPDNLPPSWAAALVERRVAEATFLAHPDGRLAAFLPIKLAQLCTKCHGDPAELAPEVRDRLAERYPTDQATGFRPGDLRGWFWIEVPSLD
jgi:hypothetical protein